MDGTYDGDVSGSFGIIRLIEDKVTQRNDSGVNFEVNKIRNENWLNVSSVFMILDEEINAEHNLTYEYTVPQSIGKTQLLGINILKIMVLLQMSFPKNLLYLWN